VSKSLPFKRLASELAEHGVVSEYLARVEARLTPEQQLENLQVELAQEIASALGRTEMRVNMALAELQLQRARYDRALAEGASEHERKALVEAFNALRLQAQARVRELLIQREALGFRRNQILNELYPIPPRLT
jgi:predicted DNA binding CopG/RHH family protein